MKVFLVLSTIVLLSACGNKSSTLQPIQAEAETCLNQTQLNYLYGVLGISPGSGLPITPGCGSCSKSNSLAGFVARKDPNDDGRARLFAYGDSIVQGIYRCYEGAHYEFPQLVADALGMSNRNHGVGASKIADYYGQSGEILRSVYEPTDTVVILTLHNDLSQFQSDSAHLDASKALLIQSIQHIQKYTSRIYVGTPLSLLVYSQSVHSLYAQVVIDAVTATGVTLVDTGTQFVAGSDNIGTDGVHPNAEGDRQIAQIFINAMR